MAEVVLRNAAVSAVLVVAGCVGAQAPGANACGAAGMQDLVGKDWSVPVAMNLPPATRVIRPGMSITEEYSPSRLNIDLDDRGRVTRVWCG